MNSYCIILVTMCMRILVGGDQNLGSQSQAKDTSSIGPADPIHRGAKHCQFLQVKDFMLVGFAEEVNEKVSLDGCKSMCAKKQRDKPSGLGCNSAQYWPDDKTCVLTSRSKGSDPALFVHTPKENVIYLEYVCDIGQHPCEDVFVFS